MTSSHNGAHFVMKNQSSPLPALAARAKRAAAIVSNVTVRSINSRARPDRVAVARHIAITLTYDALVERGWRGSHSATARVFSLDPSTIYYALDAFRNRCDTCPRCRALLARARALAFGLDQTFTHGDGI